jgi:hypothetical protein
MRAVSFLDKLPHRPHPKLKFTPAEDALLTAAVEALGTKNWDEIAARLPGRNSRQCRDRWDSYLSPTIGNGPWTAEEEALLTDLVGQFGSSWKRIAISFPSRTDINVKSRWQLMQRRARKQARLPIPQPFLVPLPQTHKAPEPENDPDLFQSLMMNEDGRCDVSFDSWF